MDFFTDPVILVNDNEPRILDSVFNVTGLVSNLFNGTNNALFTYVGGLVLFIVLVGKTPSLTKTAESCLTLEMFRDSSVCPGCLRQPDLHLLRQ